jgi:hypothetical protein
MGLVIKSPSGVEKLLDIPILLVRFPVPAKQIEDLAKVNKFYFVFDYLTSIPNAGKNPLYKIEPIYQYNHLLENYIFPDGNPFGSGVITNILENIFNNKDKFENAIVQYDTFNHKTLEFITLSEPGNMELTGHQMMEFSAMVNKVNLDTEEYAEFNIPTVVSVVSVNENE